MAHDFAKRSKSRKKKPPKRFFSLSSYLAGVVTGLGLFLLGAYGPELLQWRENQAQLAASGTSATQPTPNDNAPEPAAQQEAAADPAASQPPDLEFIFRDLLGEDEVDPDLSPYESTIAAQTANSTDQPMQYLLQSGSFQIKPDAESRRGSLLLLNLPANIVEAEIEGKVWYRVIVGPYTQRGEAQQAVLRLKANDISSMWLERPLVEG